MSPVATGTDWAPVKTEPGIPSAISYSSKKLKKVTAFIKKELPLNQALLNLRENGNDSWGFCTFSLPLTTEQGGPERSWGALESSNANTGNFPCGLP